MATNRTPARLTLQSEQSDADQISLYLEGKQATLSAALKKKLDRLLTTADLLRRDGSVMTVAKKLQNLWPDDCSRATAYRYVQEAQEVFAPQQLHDREFYVDTVLGMMFSTREKAIVKQDLKTAAATEKNIANMILKFMGTAETMPIDKIQPPRILFGYMPELVGKGLPANYEHLLAQIVKTRKVGIVADQFEEAQVVEETSPASA